MTAKKIASETLDFILASCKASHPHEFGALLEADGDVITNIIYLPGTTATDESVSLNTWMLPNMKHAGSIHSHPNGAIYPSEEDLIFFQAGDINLIVGHPYNRTSWKAFDRSGNKVSIEIVDYDFQDDLMDDEMDDDF
ncbi:Mov34/MPN/PAD-1 family protein [Methanolapillus ohkumae]|uniref:JAB domain-containing protein n=1 Tax=Methanolapillus ohkumae TaxID=3028298 RepID=A0AA96ZVV2_9EURY|nr:hypothetical protein MsAm2_08970 [Methanosarcinaceae archaeon Am2]